MGQGEKSTFWYWELNYELGYYREFRTTDLAKGKERFRAEVFDAWFEEAESESSPSLQIRTRRIWFQTNLKFGVK